MAGRWVLLMGLGISLSAGGEGQSAEAPSAPPCQTAVRHESLSLQEALTRAYLQNPKILTAREDLEKSRAGVLTAAAPFEPTVTASLQGERFVNENPAATAVTAVGSSVVGGPGSFYSNYPSLSLNWNLYNGGRDTAGRRAAEASVSASDADLANQVNDTLNGVLSAYNDLLDAQLAADQKASALTRLKEIAQRAQERFGRGLGTFIAVSQSRVAYSQAERELLKSCRAVLDKSAALAQAIGLRVAPGEVLRVAEPLPELSATEFREEAVESAVQSDPAVLAARERQAAAQQKLTQARAEFHPTLAFVTRYDWLGQRTTSYTDAFSGTHANSYRIGFVLQQPLFPYASYRGDVGSAEAELRKADAALEQAEIDADTRLRTALSAKAESDRAAESAARSAEDAAKIQQLSVSLFEHGRTDLDTVERARLDVEREREAAEELVNDERLSAWQAYRALHPGEFAGRLRRAMGAADAPPER